jgi:cytidine deaminase
MADEALMAAARALLAGRAGDDAVVAAARTCSGRILTGVHVEARLDAASLCAEAGPICEAHRLGDPIAASLCLWRERPGGPARVLPACGVCQERLAVWGMDVRVAVPLPDGWGFRTLRELRPHDWADPTG